MKNDPVLSRLGLCRKAGKLVLGYDMSLKSVLEGSARLAAAACDSSEKAVFKLSRACGECGVPFYTLRCTAEELSRAAGSKAAFFSVTDAGMAKGLSGCIRKIEGEE